MELLIETVLMCRCDMRRMICVAVDMDMVLTTTISLYYYHFAILPFLYTIKYLEDVKLKLASKKRHNLLHVSWQCFMLSEPFMK